jgi:hypothetical protein
MVQTSDIRHVNFAGQVTPQNQPADTRSVTRGQKTYYLDYHIYMFDISVRTVADKKIVGQSTFTGGAPVFQHETSWSHFSDEGLGFTDRAWTGTGKVGAQFSGGAYLKFAISPWTGVAGVSGPENSIVTGAWSGIMNAYIFSKEQGQVANQWDQSVNPSDEALSFVKGGLDNGAQVPMYVDDGTFGTMSTNTVNWDTNVTPDTRIPSTNILYFPVQESAGAYLSKNWVGAVSDVIPCDVYVKYTVRVDVLTTHEFTLQTAQNPPTLAPPIDYVPLPASTNPLAWLNAVTIILIVLLIVAVVIVVKLVRWGIKI